MKDKDEAVCQIPPMCLSDSEKQGAHEVTQIEGRLISGRDSPFSID